MPLSKIFKALADDTRLRILGLLCKKELCVCQIAKALSMSQPNVSKHLGKLSEAGIIECNKISQWCFYRYQHAFKNEFAELYAFLLSRFENDPQCATDIQALRDVIEANLCCREVLAKLQNR